MSIIHDALKKVEKSVSGAGGQGPEKQKPKVKTILLYASMLVLGLFVAALLFKLITPLPPSPKVASTSAPAGLEAVPAVLQQPTATEPVAPLTVTKVLQKPVPSLILNGVFFSKEGGYALINNRIVKVGDIIEGAKVERITSYSVELNFEGTPFKLFTQPH